MHVRQSTHATSLELVPLDSLRRAQNHILMALEICDSAQAVHEVVGTSTVLLARVRPTSSFEEKAKADANSIQESGTRLGVPPRQQVVLDGLFAVVVMRVKELLGSQRCVVV